MSRFKEKKLEIFGIKSVIEEVKRLYCHDIKNVLERLASVQCAIIWLSNQTQL